MAIRDEWVDPLSNMDWTKPLSAYATFEPSELVTLDANSPAPLSSMVTPLLPTELLRTRFTPSKPALPEDVLSIVPPLRTLTFIGKLVEKEVVLEDPMNVVFEVPATAILLDRMPSSTLVLTLIPLEVSTDNANPGSDIRLAEESVFAFGVVTVPDEPRSICRDPSGFN